MKNHLLIEGKKYIRSREAATLTGYSLDYVGQLSRSGKIDSKLIGRTWFVSEESIVSYKNLGLEEASKFRTSASRDPENTMVSEILGKFVFVTMLLLVIIASGSHSLSYKYGVVGVVAQNFKGQFEHDILNPILGYVVKVEDEAAYVGATMGTATSAQTASVLSSVGDGVVLAGRGLKTFVRNWLGIGDNVVVLVPEVPVASAPSSRPASTSTSAPASKNIVTRVIEQPTYVSNISADVDRKYVDEGFVVLRNEIISLGDRMRSQTDNVYDYIGSSGNSSSGGNGISDLSSFDTGDLLEGSNLYFTNGRVSSALALATSTTFGGDVLATTFYGDGSNLTGLSSFSTSTTRGAFSATSSLTYDSANGVFGIATSTLGLTTSDILEGTRLYYTNARFDERLSATTSLPNITTLAGLNSATALASIGTITSGVWNGTAIGDAYLTKTGDWTGIFDGQEGSFYLTRGNHTGTQLASTISDFTTTARGLFSSSATGLDYTSGTGVFSLTSGYNIPLTASTTNWNGFYDTPSTRIGTSGAISWAGNTLAVSTSSLGLTTSNIPEGLNLYYTTDRFDSRLSATTSLPNITTLAGLTSASALASIGTITSGIWNGTVIGDAYLTKSGDWTGVFDGIEGSAYLSRANHTGTQLASTISDFSTGVRGLLSSSATGLTYTSGTGDFSLTSGYNIPLTASTTEWANKISSQWTTSGSNIYYNSGNVGIGTTTTSAAKLIVQGTAGTNPFIIASSTGTSLLTVTQAGSVGVGTSSPTFPVDIISPHNLTTDIVEIRANNLSQGVGINYAGITKLGSGTTFAINGAGSGSILLNNSGTGNITMVAGGGKVGMGTTTPSARLAVTGIAGTEDLFRLASSTDASLFSVSSAGLVKAASTFSSGVAGTGAYYVDGGTSSGITSAYGAGQLGLAYGGGITAGVNGSGINLGLNQLTFAPTSPNGTKDVAIQRKNAGQIEINSGTANIWRDLIVRNLSLGTTSTSSVLTIQGTSTDPTKNLFSVASSTGTTLLTVSQAGNLGIGSSTPAYTLSVNGTVGFQNLNLSSTGNYLCMDTTTNQITSGTLCTLSSSRFKQNIQNLDLGLNAVLALQPVTFNFKQGYGDNGATEQLGFVAEQAEQVDPRLVPHDKDGLPSGFNYQNYTAVLTKAIQEQQVQIDALKNATSSNTTIIQQTIVSATSTEPTQSFINTVAEAVRDLISGAGEWVLAKVSASLAVFTRVETQTAAVSQGLEMKDQVTGQTYCVTIKNGDWDKMAGTCVEIASSTASTSTVVVAPNPTVSPPIVITPDPISTSTPEVATSTLEAMPAPASSPTPELEVVLEPATAPESTPEVAPILSEPIATTDQQ